MIFHETIEFPVESSSAKVKQLLNNGCSIFALTCAASNPDVKQQLGNCCIDMRILRTPIETTSCPTVKQLEGQNETHVPKKLNNSWATFAFTCVDSNPD